MKAFISYAFADKDIMNLLKLVLEKHNLEVYAAEHDKKFGSLISEKIQDAINKSDVLIAIVTKKQTSESVHQEIGYAIKQGIKVIPFVEERAKVGFMISGIEQRRFLKDNVFEACEDVAHFLKSSKSRRTLKKEDDEEIEQDEVEETRIIGSEDYALYEFELEKDDILVVEVDSQEAVDVLILNNRNLGKFEDDADFYFEDSADSVRRTRLVFENPRRGGWNVVVDNPNKRKTEVDIKIYIE